jgi:hypothetical protein
VRKILPDLLLVAGLALICWGFFRIGVTYGVFATGGALVVLYLLLELAQVGDFEPPYGVVRGDG